MDHITDIITSGSKGLKGPQWAALFALLVGAIGTGGNIILWIIRRSTRAGCDIRRMDDSCIEAVWNSRRVDHGWNVFFDILDCISYILMIWVFDGLRTVNKDRDIGDMMVASVKLGAVINIISSLFNTGVGGTANWIRKDWTLKPNHGNYWAQFEIAYMLSRESFMLIYVVDEFIMAIPYIWCGFLVRDNQKFGQFFGRLSTFLGLLYIINFFVTLIVTATNAYIISRLLWIVVVIVRIIWLYGAYVNLKQAE